MIKLDKDDKTKDTFVDTFTPMQSWMILIAIVLTVAAVCSDSRSLQ